MPDAPASNPLPTSRTAAPTYSERLWLGPGGWVLLALFAAMMAVAFIPLDRRVAAVVGVVVLALGAAVLVGRAPRVEVRDGVLRAGGAHIPVALLGSAVPLDADATRAELGPRLDARAHVCLRGWIRTAVRVEVRDPEDPTPYWVISTRRPTELAAALQA
ncbi:DUF3093 domain-containing protein [Cellulomonas fengjieae]|uniref:DUF3093 domain-containing protein n=1 Tax=Cellulomonas fengjieae TaxID=2819978 RepID=A0ABS3SGV5_9CELL|nr:DUF3093 domain-containing protein [Cellulomonas fengjieae]MBO3084201.1 DUF3093 domain-containing protein [Cellulomonas fengjieae]QVI64555.1 DUF3093 domain-containing protein [Cellulomonas fengjieae]